MEQALDLSKEWKFDYDEEYHSFFDPSEICSISKEDDNLQSLCL
jgi:hypothetical protein